jgi:hypothetical protein
MLSAALIATIATFIAPGPTLAATPATDEIGVTGVKHAALRDLHEKNRAAQVASSGAATQAMNCDWNTAYTIFSRVTGKYASTEIGYSGADYAMVRARAAAVGPWELYISCYDSALDYNAFISLENGNYLRAEVSYPGGSDGMVRAAGTTAGVAEQFRIADAGSGWISIKSRITGHYVTTELNYPGNRDGMLRARSTTVGTWEQYR